MHAKTQRNHANSAPQKTQHYQQLSASIEGIVFQTNKLVMAEQLLAHHKSDRLPIFPRHSLGFQTTLRVMNGLTLTIVQQEIYGRKTNYFFGKKYKNILIVGNKTTSIATTLAFQRLISLEIGAQDASKPTISQKITTSLVHDLQ